MPALLPLDSALASSTPMPRLPWPAPHHMHLIDPGASSEPERGLVTLVGGEKILGEVRRVDFEAGRLEFLPERGPLRVLPFDSFRSLFLSRSVELEAIPLALPPGGLVRKPAPDKRRCTVHFKDGAALEVEVLAVLPREAGLFLYVVHYGNEVLRWFLPAQAVLSYQVGAAPAAAPPASRPDASPPQAPTPPLAANLGEYLRRSGVESRDELERALKRQKAASPRDLGTLLIEDRLITPGQLEEAEARLAGDPHRYLGDLLVEMGALPQESLRQVLVSQLGVPCANLARFQYDPNAIKVLSPELARKYKVMPLYRTDRRIVVGIEDPLSWQALRELEFFTGLKVDPVMAAGDELTAAIEQFYGKAVGDEKVTQLVAQLGDEGDEADAAPVPLPVSESDNTLVRLVNKIIVDAYDHGASDIHIESRAENKPTRVRLRIDGALRPYVEVPPNFRAALISRIKIMSELDIAEHRRPQDGKIRFEDFGPRKLELRVLVMPTVGGLEDVVMRVLAAPRALSLEQLGLAPADLQQLKAFGQRSFGLFLVCGPTGSGKTTTLHSLLGHINTPDRKIYTVEDPVEITQDGFCQVQVNPKLGLTFPAVLRSFLRADPDVIMVGETRDLETARTLVAASLTGHLVLSTMHTNSAVESIARLLDFGLDPFNFSDALLGVVGQRLVRRLCQCKTAYSASAGEIETLAHEYCRETGQSPADVEARWRSRYGASDGSITLHGPAGCPACDHTGYRGRLGVYELLVVTPPIKAAIQGRATSAEILQLAAGGGMVTLEQDAIDKILQGHLDFKQVLASCR